MVGELSTPDLFGDAQIASLNDLVSLQAILDHPIRHVVCAIEELHHPITKLGAVPRVRKARHAALAPEENGTSDCGE